jgi:hypothetical protein
MSTCSVRNHKRSCAALMSTVTMAAAAVFAFGCRGEIGGPASQPSPSGSGSGGSVSVASGAGGAGSGAGGSGGLPNTVPPLSQPVASMHKLTIAEFTNSLRDLLGGNAVVALPLEPDQQLDGFRSVSASVVAVSPTGVSQYETAINAATRAAFSTAAQASTILPCVPTSATDAACPLSQVVNGFGRRALRRPLTSADVTRYVSVATDIAQEPGGTILTGLQYAVSAILQSPEFLYRVELGTPSTQDGGRTKYTDFEMASRLASLLWVSVPDDSLLNVAAGGGLSTQAGVLSQAKAMLASQKAHQSVSNFAADLYGLDASSGTPLTTTFKDPAFYPNWTSTLPGAMQQELFLRIDDVAFTGDYLSLYDSQTVFVNNELAKIYGLPKVTPDAFRKVMLPAASHRLGLLGSGAILASNGLPQRSSPTLRGRFVAEQLLCKTVPPPPPGVNTAVLDTLPPGSSVKAILEQHRQSAACAVCHSMMDPIGLGLENFDSVGVYRATANNVPIDATGVLDGVAFQDEASLGTVLRNHPQAGPCLVSKLYEQAQGRTLLPIDGPVVDELSKQFDMSGHRIDQLLLGIVSDNSYRFVEIATK